MTEPGSPVSRARAVWHAADAGVLSTLSVDVPGYPFGSVTPFVTTPGGRAVVYVSAIAQHTRNMRADPRVCITAQEGRPGDKQAQGRVTLLGDASLVPEAALPAVERRYLALYPESRGHSQAHDFSFWWIEPRRVRYIGGFGDIHWLEPEAWAGAAPEWEAGEAGILEHMNQDHPDALEAISRRHLQAPDPEPRMLALSPYGFHVTSAAGAGYVPFAAPCLSSEQVRAEMVRLTREARESPR